MNSKILIVDDEANIRKVLKALLEQEHYTVHEARDGIEALALLKKEEIHTIITDLRMPNLDGMGLLKSVSKSYPDIPVIIITAHESVDSAVSALKLGALDYISKPFDKLEMMDVVKKAITDGITTKNGASHQINLSARLGTIFSLSRSLKTSAMDCNEPCQPTIIGPIRF